MISRQVYHRGLIVLTIDELVKEKAVQFGATILKPIPNNALTRNKETMI